MNGDDDVERLMAVEAIKLVKARHFVGWPRTAFSTMATASSIQVNGTDEAADRSHETDKKREGGWRIKTLLVERLLPARTAA